MWAPAVSRTGTAYTLQTGNACGKNSRIVRYKRGNYGGSGHVLFNTAPGIDSSKIYTTRENDKTVLYWEHARCRNLDHGSDIYKTTDIHT
jgi:hypothetical protein